MSDSAKQPAGDAELQSRVSTLEATVRELQGKLALLFKAEAAASAVLGGAGVSPASVGGAMIESVETMEDESRLVAILTAAAMAVVGQPVVVRKITFINQNTVSGWAEAGRQSIHYSHNIRR